MSQVIPPIYAPPTKPIRLTWRGRVLASLTAVAAAGIILTAMRLSPSASGMGTHQAMGLMPCNMLVTLGIPCPSCGMTTSFAWFYRGNFLASLYVQPAGFVLAYLTFAVAFFAVYEVCTGRPVHRLLRLVPLRMAVIVGGVIVGSGWVWKIAIYLTGHDGWR